LGIEPPDLEGEYWQKVREEEEKKAAQDNALKIIYHIKNQDKENNNTEK
jgi:hypothetical protein